MVKLFSKKTRNYNYTRREGNVQTIIDDIDYASLKIIPRTIAGEKGKKAHSFYVQSLDVLAVMHSDLICCIF